MAWTTPGTAVAGEVLTAAFWNEQVRDNLDAIRAAQVNVVQGTATANTTVNNNVFADIGLSVTITPTFATSKILITARIRTDKSSGNVDNGPELKLVRNSTDIYIAVGSYTGTTLRLAVGDSFVYLDSPNTTSAITYKVQLRNTINAAGVSVLATATSPAVLIAQEIPV